MWRMFNKRVGAAADDLEPLTKLTHNRMNRGKTWFKIHDGILELYVVPSWTRELGQWIWIRDLCPMYGCMHTPACLPACWRIQTQGLGQRGYGSTTGLYSCYCFVLFNAASLNLGKTKTIGGLCFGSFEVFVFVVVASRTKLPAGTLT